MRRAGLIALVVGPMASACLFAMHAAAYPTAQELCGPPEATERYEECVVNTEQGEREEAEEQAEKEREERHHDQVPEGLKRAPTVRRADAQYLTLAALHENRNWRQRDWGFVDCREGRINRTHWRCKLGWVNGAYCFQGRAQVEGAWFNPNEHNRPWFKTSWRARGCAD
jgi:hypothetical protein